MNGGSFYLYVGKDNSPYVPNHSVINGLISDESILDDPLTYKRLTNRILSHRDDVRSFQVLIAAEKKFMDMVLQLKET